MSASVDGDTVALHNVEHAVGEPGVREDLRGTGVGVSVVLQAGPPYGVASTELTPAERRVADLVAAGATNRARLYVVMSREIAGGMRARIVASAAATVHRAGERRISARRAATPWRAAHPA